MATTDPGLLAPANVEAADIPHQVVGRTPWQLFWMRLRKDRAAMIALFFVGFLVLVAVLAPLISRILVHHGPNELFNKTMLDEFGLPKGPNAEFYFGADTAGRDVFVRTLYGTRTALIVALFATSLALIIGVTLGMIAGYFRGWVDTAISRAMDIVLAMPLLVFAIGISAACSVTKAGCFGGLIKPGLPLVVFIIALFSWSYIGRIVRGQALTMREREFVEAARSIGASHPRIMLREILPNLIAPIVIYATLLIPANILFEAYLSFLGLGLPHTIPSWGQMIASATQNGVESGWWIFLFPGLMLVLTTLAFNLLGDGLRDALDPSSDRI